MASSRLPPQMEVIRLWQLPDDFFSLALEKQWLAVKQVTAKASPLSKPRPANKMNPVDEALMIAYFLVTLGLPWVIIALIVISLVLKTYTILMITIAVSAALGLHPLPRFSFRFRNSRLALALIRYFSMEILVDRRSCSAE